MGGVAKAAANVGLWGVCVAAGVAGYDVYTESLELRGEEPGNVVEVGVDWLQDQWNIVGDLVMRETTETPDGVTGKILLSDLLLVISGAAYAIKPK